MGRQKNYKNILNIFIFAIVFFSFCTGVSFAQYGEKTIVKVGTFYMANYYTRNDKGAVVGYDTEVLSRLEEYSDLQFVYVDCVSWDNALKKLENHEIDLLGTAQWNPERENKYAFCLIPYGYTVEEFFALPDSKIVYEDFDAIGKATIGFTNNYVRRDNVLSYLAEHNLTPKVKTYENQKALEAALENGEVDLMAANSHTARKEWKIVDKMKASPFFFISYKGNDTLVDKIDAALIRLNLGEPEFDDNLLKKYFPSILGAPLTKEEQNLINEGKVYTIYYDEDARPIVWLDKKENKMKGVLVDACKQITAITGLQIAVKSRNEMPSSPADTTIKYTTLFLNTKQDLSGQPGVTDALMTENFNYYYTSSDVNLKNSKSKVAVTKNRNALKAYVEEDLPLCTVVEYDSPRECMEAIINKDVDAAYLSSSIAHNLIATMGVNNVREYPVGIKNFGIGMMFTGENSKALASIVNKGIDKLDKQQLNDAMVQYVVTSEKPFNWYTFFANNVKAVISLAVFLLLLLISITWVFAYAKAMKKQKDAIAKVDEDRSKFFSRMSHDMRTPMNGILGMVALSEDEEDVNALKNNISKIKESGNFLLSLINETLDIQRIDNNKLEIDLQEIRTADLVENVLSMVRPTAQNKGVNLVFDKGNIDITNYIKTDKIRIEQIFVNLLSNAIKFTPVGGTVKFAIKILAHENGISQALATISDTGVGMSQEFLQNGIFHEFSQETNPEASNYAGTGLGLSIVKKIVTIMGGKIEVNSTLGEGTTFKVYLNFERVSNPKKKEEKVLTPDSASNNFVALQGKNILLVEDHPLNAEIANRLLSKKGCIITWVKDGQEAVNTFKADPAQWDLILMDVLMPNMDGLEATKAIRALGSEEAKKVPIIAMTANAYESDVKNCLEAGMNDHVAKPVKPEKLYETLSKYFTEA